MMRWLQLRVLTNLDFGIILLIIAACGLLVYNGTVVTLKERFDKLLESKKPQRNKKVSPQEQVLQELQNSTIPETESQEEVPR